MNKKTIIREYEMDQIKSAIETIVWFNQPEWEEPYISFTDKFKLYISLTDNEHQSRYICWQQFCNSVMSSIHDFDTCTLIKFANKFKKLSDAICYTAKMAEKLNLK